MSHSPTAEQEAILAAARGKDNLMIKALAGVGKTTTLEMLAKVLPVQPSLALAFNTRIKKELEPRLPSHFSVKTFNALGHRAWSQKLGGMNLTLAETKLGKLVSESLKNNADRELWADVRHLVTAAMNAGLVPRGLGEGLIEDTEDNWFELAEEKGISLEATEYAPRVLRESVRQAFGGVITYDDQIYCSALLGGNFPKFPLIMVDEAQDLSPLNHLQLQKTGTKDARLIVVGDPKQAIYAFRGADSLSMDNLRTLRPNWQDLPLTVTFRCPKAIVARVREHAPMYKAADSAPAGVIDNWKTWNVEDIPMGAAVLCRNNAPLLSLAFKLLAAHIAPFFLGRDIGKNLIGLSKKILPDNAMPTLNCIQAVNSWADNEVAMAIANGKLNHADGLNDRRDSLIAVLTNGPKNAGELRNKLEEIFAKDRGSVTLSSGHRCKGLEWKEVVHLDPWRVPSKNAKTEKEIEQENNVRYVIETRTKHRLILASMSGLEKGESKEGNMLTRGTEG